MSCHGKTDYTANGDLKDWHIFRERTLDLARAQGNEDFVKYVSGVSDKAWKHILEENFFTPENAVSRLRGFYQSDVVPYRDGQK